MVKPIIWENNCIKIIDQTKLPHKVEIIKLTDVKAAINAIKTMQVRGAPALGVIAAYGTALGAIKLPDSPDFPEKLSAVITEISSSRPTARNLFWALERIKGVVNSNDTPSEMRRKIVLEALKIHQQTEEADRKLSEFGSEIIKDGFNILTHCNAGALATGGYGTALGVIKLAAEKGNKLHVYATETRPLLQGARLTTWELTNEKIPVTLITDSMVGYFMNRGHIDCVIVGADRIARNGDTANKIGTYNIAVIAADNGIPFYIAAPLSTFDLSIASGIEIPIEERAGDEVRNFAFTAVVPTYINVRNPAFDVTPNIYISGIITEKGIITQPFKSKISELFREATNIEC